MSLSSAMREAIWDRVLAGTQAGIDTQRILADEFARRAAKATGKRREKLSRLAADARRMAAEQAVQLASIIGATSRSKPSADL